MELKKNKYAIETRRKPFRSDEQIDGFYVSYRHREQRENWNLTACLPIVSIGGDNSYH